MEEKQYPIGGYAPGSYHCNCCKCGTFFLGDKRAVECELCAVAAKEKFDALSLDEQAEVIKRNIEAVNELFKDWGKKPDVNLAIIGHGKPEINHDRVIASQVAGMPLEEAMFQDGYTAGHDAGYEKGRREVQPGAVWVKESDFEIVKEKIHCTRAISKGFGYIYHSLFIDINGVRWVDGQVNTTIELEVLDESGTPATGISQDAHEKEVLMQAFDKVRQIFDRRSWIMDGRGSYPYNDDRYKEEVRYMYNEFDKVFKETWDNIESKSFEYRQAIIADYRKSPAAGREEDAVALIKYIRENYKKRKDGWTDNFNIAKLTDQGIYELFKQKEK